ncbi:AER120Cp [Eremothecium gossypii ATCC 10895]|uniref:AER120Cp n=1 Tax=Eremothecium gossypii (strain ATCC 10895 / CBS 109.51 / FGSC 9923 / NRRL Y-1056) TaxID=284811 RepID=Q756Z3_EREGS|nr:AER120Cp [Eremothecium gossypii ATCC 10895]AAS52804.2 AER120Cp [Eremothecium gossypii ATCC 10895]AEY97110.1 FAER120Cp [Eremothecium gossypii FDAG1]
MGNSDSKLTAYREHIEKLAGPKEIPLYSCKSTSHAAVLFYKQHGSDSQSAGNESSREGTGEPSGGATAREPGSGAGIMGWRTLRRNGKPATPGTSSARSVSMRSARPASARSAPVRSASVRVANAQADGGRSAASAGVPEAPEAAGEGDIYCEFFTCLAQERFSAEDIYALLSAHELRHIFMSNSRNYQNLVRFACFKICSLTTQLQMKRSEEDFNKRCMEAINCIRILTKIMPVFFEMDKDESLEKALMWDRNSAEVTNYNAKSASTTAATVGASLSSPEVDPFGFNLASPAPLGDVSSPSARGSRLGLSPDSLCVAVGNNSLGEEVVPLGVILVQSCLNLLFMEGFTLPVSPHKHGQESDLHTDFYAQGYGRVSFSLWEPGINIEEMSSAPANPRLDSNRLEILRLLITLCSTNLYKQDAINRYLTVLCTMMPNYNTVCLVSSLVNVLCKYCSETDENHYNPQTYSSQVKTSQLNLLRKSLSGACISMLNLMLRFQLPEENTAVNSFVYSLSSIQVKQVIEHTPKAYLSSLSKEFDLKLILRSLASIIKSPMDIAVEQESNPFTWSQPGSVDRRHTSNGIGPSSAGQQGPHNPAIVPIRSASAQGANGVAKQNGFQGNNYRPQSSSTSSSGSFNSATTELFSLNLQAFVFLWELMKCNRAFENYVADKYSNKLILVSIFYLKYYQDVPEFSTTLIPVIGGFVTYLSSKNLVLYKMMDPLNLNYYTNKIPNIFKLSSGNITLTTYRDFAIIHLSNIAITQVTNQLPLKPYMFELIYNLLSTPSEFTGDELSLLSSNKRSAHSTGLSYQASTNLLLLLSKMATMGYLSTSSYSETSRKSYTYSSGAKLDNLALLLRGILTYILFYFQDSKNLLFALCRNERIIYQLDNALKEFSDGLTEDQLRQLYSPDDRRSRKLLDKEDDMAMPRMSHLNDSRRVFTNHALYFNPYIENDVPDQTSPNENDDYSGSDDENDLDDANNFGPTWAGPAGISLANNKSAKVYEHLDYDRDLTMKDTKLYLSLRPTWPLGLTLRGKWKTKLHTPLHKGWLGAATLSQLMQVVRVVNGQFPQIAEIKTNQYYDLLKKIGDWEQEFLHTIETSLTPEIKAMDGNYETLKLDWDENSTASRWYLSVIWGNIFTAHSHPYSLSAVDKAAYKQHNLTSRSSLDNSTANYNTSRADSASSVVNSSLGSDYPPNGANAASPNLGRPSWHSAASSRDISSKESQTSSNYTSNGASSVFRMGWLNFSRGVAGSDRDNGTADSGTRSQSRQFVPDVGLLRPNIWVGTRITMFKVKVEIKEEFSLMEMTGSFFRSLRLNTSATLNSSDYYCGSAADNRGHSPADTRIRAQRRSLSGQQSLLPTKPTMLASYK